MKTCKECQFELVEIKRETMIEITTTFRPAFSGLPKNWRTGKTEWLDICPRCNAYALGMDMTEGFPLRLQSGEGTTIHDISSYDLWGHK